MYKNRQHPTEAECRLFCCPILLSRCRFCSFLKLLSYRHTAKLLSLLFISTPQSIAKPSPGWNKVALLTAVRNSPCSCPFSVSLHPPQAALNSEPRKRWRLIVRFISLHIKPALKGDSSRARPVGDAARGESGGIGSIASGSEARRPYSNQRCGCECNEQLKGE